MPESASKCPMFQNGCPYSSSLEENSAFRHYLTQCKSFKEEGCPFKDLISVEHIKSVIAAKQFSEEYSKEVLMAHLEPGKMDLAKARQVCPAFKDGCIFAKKPGLKIAACPVWKNGCPFKLLVSEGGISLVEAFQSNSWHLLLSAVDKDQDEPQDSEPKSESFPIASMLKEGTQESHALAESVQFVKRFRKKEITRELYQLLIRNLYFVYANMERLVDQWSERNKNIKSLNFEQLKREATLEKDLQFFYGDDWRSIIMPHSQDTQDLRNMSPATANYVKRLMQIAEDPDVGGELLISHAYTRYLGDLSGGQLLKRMARRSMNLPTAPRNATVQEISRLPIEQVEGTEFYDFLQIPDANSFKNMYRRTLDSLSVTSDVAQQMVVEANVAFRLNMELFQELDEIAGFTDPDAPKELPKALPNSHPQIPAQDPSAPAAQCPFSTMFSSKPKTSAPKLAPEQTAEQTTEQILRPHPARSNHKQLYYVAFLITVLIAIFAVLFARVQ